MEANNVECVQHSNINGGNVSLHISIEGNIYMRDKTKTFKSKLMYINVDVRSIETLYHLLVR